MASGDREGARRDASRDETAAQTAIRPDPALSIPSRIAALEVELRRLWDQLDAQLLWTIATVVGAGIAFNAGELWHHRVDAPSLQRVCDEARLTSARRLGKRLQRLQGRDREGVTLMRVGHDNGRALRGLNLRTSTSTMLSATGRLFAECEPHRHASRPRKFVYGWGVTPWQSAFQLSVSRLGERV
jgi:hypothetical protein